MTDIAPPPPDAAPREEKIKLWLGILRIPRGVVSAPARHAWARKELAALDYDPDLDGPGSRHGSRRRRR
jgi:hypothetical protein